MHSGNLNTELQKIRHERNLLWKKEKLQELLRCYQLIDNRYQDVKNDFASLYGSGLIFVEKINAWKEELSKIKSLIDNLQNFSVQPFLQTHLQEVLNHLSNLLENQSHLYSYCQVNYFQPAVEALEKFEKAIKLELNKLSNECAQTKSITTIELEANSSTISPSTRVNTIINDNIRINIGAINVPHANLIKILKKLKELTLIDNVPVIAELKEIFNLIFKGFIKYYDLKENSILLDIGALNQLLDYISELSDLNEEDELPTKIAKAKSQLIDICDHIEIELVNLIIDQFSLPKDLNPADFLLLPESTTKSDLLHLINRLGKSTLNHNSKRYFLILKRWIETDIFKEYSDEELITTIEHIEKFFIWLDMSDKQFILSSIQDKNLLLEIQLAMLNNSHLGILPYEIWDKILNEELDEESRVSASQATRYFKNVIKLKSSPNILSFKLPISGNLQVSVNKGKESGINGKMIQCFEFVSSHLMVAVIKNKLMLIKINYNKNNDKITTTLSIHKTLLTHSSIISHIVKLNHSLLAFIDNEKNLIIFDIWRNKELSRWESTNPLKEITLSQDKKTLLCTAYNKEGDVIYLFSTDQLSLVKVKNNLSPTNFITLPNNEPLSFGPSILMDMNNRLITLQVSLESGLNFIAIRSKQGELIYKENENVTAICLTEYGNIVGINKERMVLTIDKDSYEKNYNNALRSKGKVSMGRSTLSFPHQIIAIDSVILVMAGQKDQANDHFLYMCDLNDTNEAVRIAINANVKQVKLLPNKSFMILSDQEESVFIFCNMNEIPLRSKVDTNSEQGCSYSLTENNGLNNCGNNLLVKASLFAPLETAELSLRNNVAVSNRAILLTVLDLINNFKLAININKRLIKEINQNLEEIKSLVNRALDLNELSEEKFKELSKVIKARLIDIKGILVSQRFFGMDFVVKKFTILNAEIVNKLELSKNTLTISNE